MLVKLYQIDPRDQVAVALCDIPAGTTQTIAGRALVVKEPIPAGHKVGCYEYSKGNGGDQIRLSHRHCADRD